LGYKSKVAGIECQIRWTNAKLSTRGIGLRFQVSDYYTFWCFAA